MKSEFDISMIDRLNSLFSSPFRDYLTNPISDESGHQELSPSSQKIVQSKSEIKLKSESFVFVIRFPIVDMRPMHDPEKAPWWQRNVRPDFLTLKFSDFRMTFLSPSIFDFMANEINIYYQESEKSAPIYMGKAGAFENTSKYYPPTVDYPRIVIDLPTQNQLDELNESFISRKNEGRAGDDTDSDPTSGESIKINTSSRDRESTPFSSKKVCRESDTPHSKEMDGEF